MTAPAVALKPTHKAVRGYFTDDPAELWPRVPKYGSIVRHNDQLDVIRAPWNEKKIIGS